MWRPSVAGLRPRSEGPEAIRTSAGGFDELRVRISGGLRRPVGRFAASGGRTPPIEPAPSLDGVGLDGERDGRGGAGGTDGTDNQAHRSRPVREGVLDMGAHRGPGGVGPGRAVRHRPGRRLAPVDAADLADPGKDPLVLRRAVGAVGSNVRPKCPTQMSDAVLVGSVRPSRSRAPSCAVTRRHVGHLSPPVDTMPAIDRDVRSRLRPDRLRATPLTRDRPGRGARMRASSAPAAIKASRLSHKVFASGTASPRPSPSEAHPARPIGHREPGLRQRQRAHRLQDQHPELLNRIDGRAADRRAIPRPRRRVQFRPQDREIQPSQRAPPADRPAPTAPAADPPRPGTPAAVPPSPIPAPVPQPDGITPKPSVPDQFPAASI